MGLLDYGFEDPQTAGLLSLGLRLMSTPGKFGTALGQAGLGAMGDMQRARAQQQDRQQAAQRQQLFEMQMKQAQQAQADAELARANEARFRGMIPDPSAQAAKAALAGGGGPTLANAQQIRSVDPQQQMLFNAMSTGQIRPMEYLSAIQKDRTPIKLGKDDRLLEPGTNRVLVDARPGKSDAPNSVEEYEYAVSKGYKGTYEQFKTLGPTITAEAMAALRSAQIGNITRENNYNFPPPPASGGAVSVTAPDGQVYMFPNQRAADQFKAKAGIK